MTVLLSLHLTVSTAYDISRVAPAPRIGMFIPELRIVCGNVPTTVVPALSFSLGGDLLEIPQVRRLLAFPGRHQQTIAAEHVALGADQDVLVVLGAIDLAPERMRGCFATVGLHHGPGARQRVVLHRHLVM